MSAYLYQQLEQQLRDEITSGQRAAGERMPSVRELALAESRSKSTVLSAYARLEADGLIEARTRSGYYVSVTKAQLKPPKLSSPDPAPLSLGTDQLLLDIMSRGAAFDIFPSDADEPSNKKLQQSLTRAQRRQTSAQYLYYDKPLGQLELRKQLRGLMRHGGADVSEDELLVTGGCQHALLLSLLATCKAGDVVAVESPGFYGSFQLIESLGLKALELPCSAQTGLSIDALRLALEHWDVTTLIVSPSFATPTGATMPLENKKALLQLASKHDFAIIEDDIYGELYFGSQRPLSLFSLDDSGRVLLCSSFSKSLSRDLRLGWVAPGRYRDAVIKAKMATTLATPQVLQTGLSDYMSEGGFDQHLRRKRRQYQERCAELMHYVQEYLPMATACSHPQGGLAAWLELPVEINTTALYEQARHEGILLTPGRLFTAQDTYQNYLRLSFAHPWTEGRQKALQTLGALVDQLQ